MPLTSKGKKILKNMIKNYGSAKKGKQVFYASQNKGAISGTHKGNPGHMMMSSGDKIVHREPICFNENSLPRVYGGKS